MYSTNSLTVQSLLYWLLAMFRQLYQIFSDKIQSLYSHRKWVIILLLLSLCTSCFSPKSSEVTLKLSVQSAGRPGVYKVIGTTNLPEHSQITAMALRYLRPTDEQFLASDPNTTYSILDRQITEVAKGKWQAILNLWQVAADGRLQEAWQLNQSQTELALNPSPVVSFVATFDPVNQLSTSQQQLNPKELHGSLVRFTSEGQPYVQARQTIPLTLPVGRTTPPRLLAEDIYGGWGNRDEIPPEPTVSSKMRPQPLQTKQTNAPLSPAEILR